MKRLTQEEFIRRAKEVHGDSYDYSKVDYKSNSTKVCIICPTHGEFWQTPAHHMTRTGCPYCSGRKVLSGYNDLLTVFPKVSEEWDYEKNDSLKPELLLPKSGKIVWWKCPKGHSYQASIIYRTTKGGGCPYCSHQKLLSGFNDLQTLYPDTLTEWDYSKNDLPPNQYMAHVAKKVWWLCPAGHSYNMTIAAHTSGRRCPICAQATHTSFPEQAIYYYLKQVYPDVINAYRKYKSELDLFIPSIETAIEYDGYYAHKDKLKKDYEKNALCKSHNIRLIRLREDKLPPLDDGLSTVILLKQNSTKSLESAISQLAEMLGVNIDIDLTRDEVFIKDLYDNFKKNRSLADVAPNLCKEWHPTKNGDIVPINVYAKTGHKYWWICDKGHEWQASPAKRVSNHRGCPYCANQRVLQGYNDLQTLYPEIAKQWSPRNNVSPSDVIGKSSKSYWWIGDCGHEWKAALSSRRKGVGCPYCANQKVLKGFNDLQTKHPSLSGEWHPTKNLPLRPCDVTSGSGKKVWWLCPVCNAEYVASVYSRVRNKKRGCPKCGYRYDLKRDTQHHMPRGK